MSPTLAIAALTAAIVTIAAIANQIHARISLLEVTLSEGLPSGWHGPFSQTSDRDPKTEPVAKPTLDPAQVLAPGIHIFVSRSCVACQHLVDQLTQTRIESHEPVHLRYINRSRPAARRLESSAAVTLHEHQAELAQLIGASVLPYTVAIGSGGICAAASTPNFAAVSAVASNSALTITATPGSYPDSQQS